MNFHVLKGLSKYAILLVSLWAAHLSMGSTIAIIGPTLPYLGLNVGESMSVVSFVYTARSIGFVLVSIGTGIIFRRLTEGWKKMAWISSGLLVMTISIIAVPFINNIILLFGALFVYGSGSAMVDTADNSIVIYLLGPTDSRPIVQSLHFTLALGAFLLPFIVRPFLIQIGESNSTQDVCSSNSGNENSTDIVAINPPKSLDELVSSPLIWPYIIVASLCAIASCMFMVMAFRRPTLNQYGQPEKEQDDGEQVNNNGMKFKPLEDQDNIERWKVFKIVLLSLFMLFYFFHCGTENVFWSHLYAFGICSALKMSPGDASLLNMAFFGGFLAGRGSGIFVSRWIRPAIIISIGITGCLLATTTLAIWGEIHSAVTMASSIIYGYSIAMIFAAGISWLAQQIDVTGAVSSTWFIGAYLGISALPPLAGIFFDTKVGPIGVMYMICGTSAAVVLIFSSMNVFLRCFGKFKMSKSGKLHSYELKDCT